MMSEVGNEEWRTNGIWYHWQVLVEEHTWGTCKVLSQNTQPILCGGVVVRGPYRRLCPGYISLISKTKHTWRQDQIKVRHLMGVLHLVDQLRPQKMPPTHFRKVLGPKQSMCEQWHHPLRIQRCWLYKSTYWERPHINLSLLDKRTEDSITGSLGIILPLPLFLYFPIYLSVCLSVCLSYQADAPSLVRFSLSLNLPGFATTCGRITFFA